MAKDLIIVGTGGFAREVLWVADCLKESWQILGFLDDASKESVDGLPVLGVVNDASNYSHASFVIAIGDPRTRRKVAGTMEATFLPKYATLIHPDAQTGHKVLIGVGSIVTAGCILTTNISLGRHNIVNLNTTVGHDVATGDFCTFAPTVAVSGNANFGSGVEVGTGASIKQGIEVGNGAIIGMGSCIVKTVEHDSVVVGNPGKILKHLEQQWMT